MKIKLLKGLGYGLIFLSIIFYSSIKDANKQAELFSKYNESRQQIEVSRANFYKIMSLVCIGSGVFFLFLGYRND